MKKLVSALIICLSLSACYKDKEQELYPNQFNPCDTGNVTFKTAIQPLINNKCATAGCHVPGATAPDLTSYNGIKASIDRIRVRAIDLKTMPGSGPLNTCDRTRLSAWMNAGALNN